MIRAYSFLPLLLASGLALAEESDSRTFPIWGDEAKARGYSIPLPFGVNVSYMNMRQNIDVDSISFSDWPWETMPYLPICSILTLAAPAKGVKQKIYASICGCFLS